MARNKYIIILWLGVAFWNRIRRLIHFERPNLRRVDLSRVNLIAINLHRADLFGVHLKNANLSTANLAETNFCRATISDVVALYADCAGASFISASLFRTRLLGSNFIKANFFSAKVLESDFREAKFNKAYLRCANFTGTSFKGADLSGANLRDAKLCGANIKKIILKRANITGAWLYNIGFDGWDIDGIQCKYIYLDKEGKQRFPRDRDFLPGEFEEMYNQFLFSGIMTSRCLQWPHDLLTEKNQIADTVLVPA